MGTRVRRPEGPAWRGEAAAVETACPSAGRLALAAARSRSIDRYAAASDGAALPSARGRDSGENCCVKSCEKSLDCREGFVDGGPTTSCRLTCGLDAGSGRANGPCTAARMATVLFCACLILHTVRSTNAAFTTGKYLESFACIFIDFILFLVYLCHTNRSLIDKKDRDRFGNEA